MTKTEKEIAEEIYNKLINNGQSLNTKVAIAEGIIQGILNKLSSLDWRAVLTAALRTSPAWAILRNVSCGVRSKQFKPIQKLGKASRTAKYFRKNAS